MNKNPDMFDDEKRRLRERRRGLLPLLASVIARHGKVAAVVLAIGGGACPAVAQVAATAPSSAASGPDSPWTFTFAPYGWLTFLSGTQTVKGQSVAVQTNAFEMFAASQSLISFMAYNELRHEDRVGFFADLVYANLTAGKGATRSFAAPGVSGSAIASASANYETLTVQFGLAYEVARIDRGTAGRTAFDVVLGGRWWYQRLDLTLNAYGALTVTAPNLTVSAGRNRVFANSGSIGWVDPLVGFRVRHVLAPGQNLLVEADLGGFGIASRLSAEAQAAYSLDFGRSLGVDWAGVIGYRALYVDYSRGSGSSAFQMNLLQHGPLLGVRGRF